MKRYLLTLPAVLALLVGLAYLGVPYVDSLLTGWFRQDVEMRSELVMSTLREGLVSRLAQAPDADSKARDARKKRADHDKAIADYLSRVTADERLLAMLVCDAEGKVLHRTALSPPGTLCATAPAAAQHYVVPGKPGLLHVSQFPLDTQALPGISVMVLHDLSFIDRRQRQTRDFLLLFIGLSALAFVLLGAVSGWMLLHGWVRTALNDMRQGRAPGRRLLPLDSSLGMNELRQLIRELEYNTPPGANPAGAWNEEAIRLVVREHLDGAPVMVVSNREPYIHNRVHGAVEVQYPASGMVTALEPVVRSCGGTWVAHGSGNADRDVVDLFNRVRVPPHDPQYTLRRVWLTPEQEKGYYYGFANEGLWPLCHHAFVRPAFRPEDWDQYRAVNAEFTAALRKEARHDAPVVLVQDYHFALLPGLIRAALPQALVALFWHIPWPNAETFGICPWRRELLEGMLRGDIIGFHTRYHCQNFLEAADRYLECNIDYEHSTVTYQGHTCRVTPYPISIEYPPRWLEDQPPVQECRRLVRAQYGLKEGMVLGLGVERWDFTKGITERLAAIECLLEQAPQWRGRLVFLQIAAPSRGTLPAYQELQKATLDLATRINERFGTPDYQPVILVPEHRGPETVFTLYRACDFCLVNSLHDGMNLVAKEFVAAREDDDGVLILSNFAGASRELAEALLINPYDLRETVAAVLQALDMPAEERAERMRAMRQTVRQYNIFRWAGRMLLDVAQIRRRRRLAQWARARSDHLREAG